MKPTAPIRQTVIRTCPTCDDKLGPAEDEICYGCFCDSQIHLKSYQKREEYPGDVTSEIDPIRRATKRARTGIAYLDVRKVIFWEKYFTTAELYSWRHREQQQGLNNREYEHRRFTDK